MITVDIPVKDQKRQPILKFPDRCVSCGKTKELIVPMKLNMEVQKRQRSVVMDLPVPLCKACERKERGIANVTVFPFFIAGSITFVLVFIPVWIITPTGTTTSSSTSS